MFGYRYEPVEGAGEYTTSGTQERPLSRVGGVNEPLLPGWSTCFSVADTDAAVATATEGGGSVLMPAQDTPFGRFAVVQDPAGATFSVMAAPESG